MQHHNVGYIDDILLDEQGDVKMVPSAELKGIPYDHLKTWCHIKGVYGLATTELVSFISQIIGVATSIEIGGGNGVFGRALNIRSTDSMIQLRDPEVRAYYALLRQPMVQYGKNIEELEASAAIDKYKPDIIFGSWITQYVSPLETKLPAGGGSIYGFRETEAIKKVNKYILFGTEETHGNKLLFQLPGIKITKHKNSEHFWSRASRHDGNVLWVIENN